MMVDDRKVVRKNALQKILNCRKKKSLKIRKFHLPVFQFDAADYTNMIKWVEVAEPPLTRNIPDDKLTDLILNKPTKFKNVMRFPYHTQAVERHVKLVTHPLL